MAPKYPEDSAGEVWQKDNITFSIVQTHMGHYYGYCRFQKRPVIEDGYNGILMYVPVHGGITYAEEAKDGTMVYGFDCAHYDDEYKTELRDPAWLKVECEKMTKCVLIAKDYEMEYLRGTNAERADVITKFHERVNDEVGAEFDIHNNTGAMLHLIGGNL